MLPNWILPAAKCLNKKSSLLGMVLRWLGQNFKKEKEKKLWEEGVGKISILSPQ